MEGNLAELLAQEQSKEALEDLVRDLPVSDTAHALTELTPEEQTRVLSILETGQAARLIEAIPEPQAAVIVAVLPPAQAAVLLGNIESDEQVDILAKMPSQRSEEILSAMDLEEARETRKRIEHPRHSAGGLMVTEYLRYQSSSRVEDVIADFRRHVESFSDYAVQYVFVVGAKEQLQGVLRLRDLLLVSPSTAVEDIMIADPVSVTLDTPLQELEDIFDRYRFLGVPVTDSDGALVGVLRRSDVEEAIGERAESDYLKTAGILGGEELRTMPLLLRSRRRLSWLSINIFLNVAAASIIALYQDTLEAVIALAVFLPIISDMSGCSGAQAIAVSIRELTMGLAKPGDLLRVWRKEVTLGIINGLALGGIIAAVALYWKGNIYLGFVVGSALAINTIVAVSVGGLLPLVLKSFDKDPALASGPILTTMTDMIGFFLVLSLAQAMLPLLLR